MAGDGKEKKHATVLFYTQIIIALAVITALEIVVPNVFKHNTDAPLPIGRLVTLAVLKYVIVVAFYMHLYYDQPLCTFLFGAGMLLAGGTMVALLHAIPPKVDGGSFSVTGPGGQAVADYTGPRLTGDAQNGLKLFQANCYTCHHLSTVAVAQGVVGPDLDGIWDRAATRRPGMTAQQYIDESIKEPDAFKTPGYETAQMTNFGLGDADRKSLVDFLMAQKNAGGSKK